jgi:ABC-2 type transport system permease protein
MCLVFKGQNASGIASGLVVIMSFLGNVFTPMDGFMLKLGHLTPLYGYAGLARYPISEGYLPMDAGHDSVWLLLANVVTWTILFAALAVWGLRRRQQRV